MKNPFDGLISLGDAAKKWQLDESTLRYAISRGKLKEEIDAKKFGKQWVITTAAMDREYGFKTDKGRRSVHREAL